MKNFIVGLLFCILLPIIIPVGLLIMCCFSIYKLGENLRALESDYIQEANKND